MWQLEWQYISRMAYQSSFNKDKISFLLLHMVASYVVERFIINVHHSTLFVNIIQSCNNSNEISSPLRLSSLLQITENAVVHWKWKCYVGPLKMGGRGNARSTENRREGKCWGPTRRGNAGDHAGPSRY